MSVCIGRSALQSDRKSKLNQRRLFQSQRECVTVSLVFKQCERSHSRMKQPVCNIGSVIMASAHAYNGSNAGIPAVARASESEDQGQKAFF